MASLLLNITVCAISAMGTAKTVGENAALPPLSPSYVMQSHLRGQAYINVCRIFARGPPRSFRHSRTKECSDNHTAARYTKHCLHAKCTRTRLCSVHGILILLKPYSNQKRTSWKHMPLTFPRSYLIASLIPT